MDKPRRFLLQAGLMIPTALVLPRLDAAPTPACGARTAPQGACPFYTPNSPAKQDFRADDPSGTPLALHTTVLDTQCRPVPGALVDLWHANTQGEYDNQ